MRGTIRNTLQGRNQISERTQVPSKTAESYFVGSKESSGMTGEKREERDKYFADKNFILGHFQEN